jgi:hypothetical protein
MVCRWQVAKSFVCYFADLFLNAKRDENWKMTVIYGIGVAGAGAFMKALFAMFGGAAGSAVTGF